MSPFLATFFGIGISCLKNVGTNADMAGQRPTPTLNTKLHWALHRPLRLRSPLFDLVAQRFLLRFDLGTEVGRLEHLANLNLGLLTRTMGGGSARGPGDRLFFRLHIDQPESGDQLLRLSERPVGDGDLSPG